MTEEMKEGVSSVLRDVKEDETETGDVFEEAIGTIRDSVIQEVGARFKDWISASEKSVVKAEREMFDEAAAELIDRGAGFADVLEVCTESSSRGGCRSSGTAESRIDWLRGVTPVAFDGILRNHPYLLWRKDFRTRYERVVKYFLLRCLWGHKMSVSAADLSRIFAVPDDAIFYWQKGNVPILMKVVADHERLLRERIASMSPEYRSHCMRPVLVYNYFKDVIVRGYETTRVVEILAKVLAETEGNLIIMEMKSYVSNKLRLLKNLGRKMRKDRLTIQKELEQMLGTYVRIAFIDSVLFIWRKSRVKKHFLLLADELFYFGKKKRNGLIRQARKHLGGLGIVKFSKVVRQLTDYKDPRSSPTDSINADLRYGFRHLSGRTLHLFLDVLGRSIEDEIENVRKLGRGDQIKSPRILDDVSFDELMTRLFAIIGSDGHIQPRLDRVQYSEWNAERRERVKKILGQLGNVTIRNNYSKEGKVVRLVLPSVLGRILIALGMPAGDKVLQGYNLPQFIFDGSFKSRCGYFEELLPEEACISIKPSGSAYVELSRRVILQDPSKSATYSIDSKLNEKHIRLILQYGREFAKFYDRDEVIERSVVLSQATLTRLTKDSKNAAVAKRLKHIVETTPPRLLDDERRLLATIGINSIRRWKEVTLYESGRVSVLWRIRTRRQEDTVRWGKIAPPNDFVKHEKFMKWLADRKSQ